MAWLREELDLPVARESSTDMLLQAQSTPIFLAQGAEEEKVRPELGRGAKDCLVLLQAEGEWREYEGLGHWYSGQVLGEFQRDMTGEYL